MPIARAAFLLSVAALGLQTPLAAQVATADTSTGTSADGGFGEDIIVTAQKREQLISDVPVTITAWSGEALRRIGVS